MRATEVEHLAAPATDAPRAIEKMAKQDFMTMMDRSAKRNNTLGMAVSSSIENRMILDDTDVESSILTYLFWNALCGNRGNILRMVEAIRKKYAKVIDYDLKDGDQTGIPVISHSGDPSWKRVWKIEEDDSNIHISLGITDERGEELFNRVNELLGNKLSITSIMEEVSKDCKHPNEIAYCCYVIGRIGSSPA